MRFQYPLDDGGKAEYALFERPVIALAAPEARSTSAHLNATEAQGLRLADHLGVPCIFLSNCEEVWFRHKTPDAHFRRVETVLSQDDLARRNVASEIRRNPLDIPLNTWMDGGGGPPLSAIGWACGLRGGRIIRTALP